MTNNKSVEIHELFDPHKNLIVHPWIIPTPSEMEMDFLTRFVPLQVIKDDKIEKLERNLNGFVAIKRDYTVIKKDFHPSKALVIGNNGVGESSRDFNIGGGGEGGFSPNVDRGFSGVDGGGGGSSPNVDRSTGGVGVGGGGGFSPFVTSGFGGVSAGFGVGRSSPIDENVSRPQETSSTTEVPSCKLCHEKIDLLTARIDSLEETIINKMSKRGIRPLSKISDPYTPDVVKRRKK